MFKYSRSSILFFRPFLYISTLAGLTPAYDFTKRRLKATEVCFYYTLLIKTGLVYLLINDLLDQYDDLDLQLTQMPSKYVYICFAFEAVISVTGYLSISLILVYSHSKNRLWEEMFQKFAVLENFLNLNTECQRERSFFKKAMVEFVLANLLLCTFLFLNILFSTGEQHFTSDLYEYLSFCYNFLIAYIMINLSTAVKCKFSDINRKVVTCKNAQFYNSIGIVRKCRYIYQDTGKIVNIINKIFGPSIFFMYVLHGIQTLYICTRIFLMTLTKTEETNPFEAKYLTIFVFKMSMLYVPVLTTMCCDYAIAESQKLISICHTLQRPLDIFSKRHQELQDFVDQIKFKKVCFTASRCFEVDRKASLLLLTVTSNYFIVIVQFLNQK